MSIFIGKSGLRTQFAKLTSTQLVSAIAPATAIKLASLNNASRWTYLHNGTDTDIAVLVVHPENDSSVVANRLLLTEIAAGMGENFEMGLFAGSSIDPGTQMYIYIVGGVAPTKGAVRLSYWG
jgi:long-subunit acyl-CoA synthetase (AMP-forming)